MSLLQAALIEGPTIPKPTVTRGARSVENSTDHKLPLTTYTDTTNRAQLSVPLAKLSVTSNAHNAHSQSSNGLHAQHNTLSNESPHNHPSLLHPATIHSQSSRASNAPALGSSPKRHTTAVTTESTEKVDQANKFIKPHIHSLSSAAPHSTQTTDPSKDITPARVSTTDVPRKWNIQSTRWLIPSLTRPHSHSRCQRRAQKRHNPIGNPATTAIPRSNGRQFSHDNIYNEITNWSNGHSTSTSKNQCSTILCRHSITWRSLQPHGMVAQYESLHPRNPSAWTHHHHAPHRRPTKLPRLRPPAAKYRFPTTIPRPKFPLKQTHRSQRNLSVNNSDANQNHTTSTHRLRTAHNPLAPSWLAAPTSRTTNFPSTVFPVFIQSNAAPRPISNQHPPPTNALPFDAAYSTTLSPEDQPRNTPPHSTPTNASFGIPRNVDPSTNSIPSTITRLDDPTKDVLRALATSTTKLMHALQLAPFRIKAGKPGRVPSRPNDGSLFTRTNASMPHANQPRHQSFHVHSPMASTQSTESTATTSTIPADDRTTSRLSGMACAPPSDPHMMETSKRQYADHGPPPSSNSMTNPRLSSHHDTSHNSSDIATCFSPMADPMVPSTCEASKPAHGVLNPDEWPLPSASMTSHSSPTRLRGGGNPSQSSNAATKTILRQHILDRFFPQPNREPQPHRSSTVSPNPDDSTWHGDPPLLLPDPSVVQVLFKNVNGLIKGDDSSGYDEWRQTGGVDMHQRGLNILGFAEINTKMTTQRKEALKSNLTAPHCKMQTSCSNIPCSTRHLPGGTLTILDKGIQGR